MSHWVSVSAVRIKVASHLATLNHFAADLGILKRQQALAFGVALFSFSARTQKHTYCRGNGATFQNSTRPGPRIATHNSHAFAS